MLPPSSSASHNAKDHIETVLTVNAFSANSYTAAVTVAAVSSTTVTMLQYCYEQCMCVQCSPVSNDEYVVLTQEAVTHIDHCTSKEHYRKLLSHAHYRKLLSHACALLKAAFASMCSTVHCICANSAQYSAEHSIASYRISFAVSSAVLA
eukprot:12355-Heterococcus_DN1.PRE.2